ncbi:MAG: FAD-dependent oxidoreductase, partial [Planctomycetaceae bacterium]
MSAHTYDCLVVGQGLAGTTFAWRLLERGARILVIDQCRSGSASRVAAGLMTPVTGQRLVLSWRLAGLWPAAMAFYRQIEAKTDTVFLSEPGQIRILASDREQQRYQTLDAGPAADWIRAPTPAINPEFFQHPHGGFEMPHAARLDVASFLDVSRDYFQTLGCLREGEVNAARDIAVTPETVRLRPFGVTAGHIVFCEGSAAAENPWFAGVRFDCTRGELLTIRIPGLTETRIVNRGVWLVPLGNGLFRAGATSDWNNLQAGPTPEGRKDLCCRLKRFLRLPFEVVEHSAGVRPIVTGRHPVLGCHPDHPRIGLFNGLGSKGCLQAPLLAEQLAGQILDHTPIDADVDVAQRFSLTRFDHSAQPSSVSLSREDIPDPDRIPAADDEEQSTAVPDSRRQRKARLTEQAQTVIRASVDPGATVIDATAGNGHDTLFLAELVGPQGMVFAFDVQVQAIEQTRSRLEQAGVTNVTLLNCSHADMTDAVPRPHHKLVSAVMFNLGFLPGGDHSLTT